MKIKEIITERSDFAVYGNDTAKIVRTPKQATKAYTTAEKGAIKNFDPKKARRHARNMYGVELVDDFVDVLELPNNENETDKAMSMFSKDQRK